MSSMPATIRIGVLGLIHDDNGVILMQYARAPAIAEGSWRQG